MLMSTLLGLWRCRCLTRPESQPEARLSSLTSSDLPPVAAHYVSVPVALATLGLHIVVAHTVSSNIYEPRNRLGLIELLCIEVLADRRG